MAERSLAVDHTTIWRCRALAEPVPCSRRPRADREAAKRFLKKALANRDNRPPCLFARDGLRSYPAAIRKLQREGLMHQSSRHR